MTNLEKYFKELVDYGSDSDMPCYWLNEIKNKDCGELNCNECRKEFLKWLNEEYKEKPQLTDDEKAILRNINNRAKYIARDEDGFLFVHYSKPYKGNSGVWDSSNCFSMKAFSHLFQFIKWEDDEPYNIEELLKEVE